MTGDTNGEKIKVSNKFLQDIANTIVVYEGGDSINESSKYDFINCDKGSGIYNFPLTISVTERGEPSPSQCFIKCDESLKCEFQPLDEVISLNEGTVFYIPKKITQWTLKITGIKEGPPSSDEHNVTIGDEPPGNN